MKADLAELLRQREIVHPTRIVAVEANHRQLRITIAGCPWWRATHSAEDERLVLSFDDVEEGVLDAETLLDMEYNHALEVFRVSPLSQEGWADGGASYAPYCSEPLAQPLMLYALVEDYLWNTAAPRSARDYLNVPDGSLARFCELTGTGSFLVATAPERVHKLVTA